MLFSSSTFFKFKLGCDGFSSKSLFAFRACSRVLCGGSAYASRSPSVVNDLILRAIQRAGESHPGDAPPELLRRALGTYPSFHAGCESRRPRHRALQESGRQLRPVGRRRVPSRAPEPFRVGQSRFQDSATAEERTFKSTVPAHAIMVHMASMPVPPLTEEEYLRVERQA